MLARSFHLQTLVLFLLTVFTCLQLFISHHARITVDFSWEPEALSLGLPSIPIGAAAAAAASTVVDFERQERVVVATKIHGYSTNVDQLVQSLCLFHQAYNQRVLYDIIVFTTIPPSSLDIRQLKEVAHPAHLQVIVDEMTLTQQVEALSSNQRAYLLNRCNVSKVEEIIWETRCKDGKHVMPLSYSWMSEFRSKQIWTQKVLSDYKYMLWLDSDAFCTETWQQDPVATMVRNDLVILFDHFPQGEIRGGDFQERTRKAFNESLCLLEVDSEGKFNSTGGSCWENRQIGLIHGFFHITNLNFYRSPIVLKWTDALIGDSKFSRRWDDQIAVTVPAALLAPNRSWDMRANGIKLNVWHNGKFGGKYKWKGGGFRKWWSQNSASFSAENYDMTLCAPMITNQG